LRQLVTLVPIAEGSSGRVYRTRDRDSGEVLAVKRLRHTDAPNVARLRREAAAQKRLDHPNICRVYGVEQDEQGHWQLFMEFVSGSTLARQMKKLSLKQRVSILAKVADAVHVAHDSGILHRDLKPANILLRADQAGKIVDPVVADFGLARSEDDPIMTSTGEILGTPAYMAPEQALADQDRVGPATDIFALGCMLYEALTGKPPFEAPSVGAGLDRLLHEDAQHPRKHNRAAPEGLNRIALQCLEREPARRYSSALALAEDLQRWLRGEDVQARRYSRLYRWQRRMRRHPMATAATVIGAIAILTLSGWSVWQAQTAAAREAVAATLGETLGDISNRMLIARLAPLHDIGEDRQVLSRQLVEIAENHGDDDRLSDLVHSNLARAYLTLGNTDRAAAHAERAAALSSSAATRNVQADVLLARYAETLVPIMELPAERRTDRLEDARQQYLAPAEQLLASLGESSLTPVDSLARLAILERRFEQAETLIDRLPDAQAHDYEKALLRANLSLEQASAALDQTQRDLAVERFNDARSTLYEVARVARSDPRPRLMACQAARELLRARQHRKQSLPTTLSELEPLCEELVAVDPGRASTYAARTAAYSTLATAFDKVNDKEQARALLRAGIAVSEQGTSIAPDDRTLLEFRSRLFFRLGGLSREDFEPSLQALDKAAEAAHRLIAVAPDGPLGPTLLGRVERDRARQLSLHDRNPNEAFARAEAAFAQAIDLDPDSPTILSEAALNAVFRFYELRLADPEAALERAEQAIALQQRALDQDPDNIDLLFDQGANLGDLWYFLALTPELATHLDRDALKSRALEMLARVRALAPGQPNGYTQAIMILLSETALLHSRDQPATATIRAALERLEQAQAQDIAITRDLATWLRISQVRNSMLIDGNVAAAIEAAWSSIDDDVDRSDRTYRQLHLLELIGLEARWRHQSGQAANRSRLEMGRTTLDELLARDRRLPSVLCHGARIVLYSGIRATDAATQAKHVSRAHDLFTECLAADEHLRPVFEDDLKLLSQNGA